MSTVRKHKEGAGKKLLVSLVIVLIIGWALRAAVQFSTDLPPGINGGYYPLQARGILRTGKTGISDFPLLFYIYAAAAFIPQLVARDAGILLTARVLDVLLPVLIAIPACMLMRSLGKKAENKSTGILSFLILGLFVVLNGSLLRMLGDFQKNSFGLALSLSFMLFLYHSFQSGKKKYIFLTIFFLALTFLTHIGTAGVTLLIGSLFLIFIFLFSKKKKIVFWILFVGILIIGLSLTLVYVFDPIRVERLVSSAVDPAELFKGSAIMRWFAFKAPPNERGLNWGDAPNLIALGIAAVGAVIAVSLKKILNPAEKSLLWSALLAASILAAPVYNPTYAQRFTLMAFMPAAIVLAFIAAHKPVGQIVSILFLLIELFFNTGYQLTHPQQTITLEAYRELENLKSDIEPDGTLVFARHGLEWWVAWTMDTNVVNDMEYFVENWDEYSDFYLVNEIDPSGFSNGGLKTGQNGQRNKDRKDDEKRPGSNLVFPAKADGGKRIYLLGQNEVCTIKKGEFFELVQVLSIPQTQPEKDLHLEINIIPRIQWGARKMNENAASESGFFDPVANPEGIMMYKGNLADVLDTIVIHHTALPRHVGVREIQDLHMDKRGFADIGYHFVINTEGDIFEGRHLNIRGTHTKNHNTGSIGIVLTGNFEDEQPLPQQIESLHNLVGFLSQEFRISYLAGHHDLNPQLTKCPGKYLIPFLDEITAKNNLQQITNTD